MRIPIYEAIQWKLAKLRPRLGVAAIYAGREEWEAIVRHPQTQVLDRVHALGLPVYKVDERSHLAAAPLLEERPPLALLASITRRMHDHRAVLERPEFLYLGSEDMETLQDIVDESRGSIDPLRLTTHRRVPRPTFAGMEIFIVDAEHHLATSTDR